MNAIETITSLLGHDGLRFGEPQSAGTLTIVPVFHTGPMAGYRLFGEAAAAGLAVVEEVGEGGVVGQLQVTNHCADPILLIEGEMLIGLKQNRTLNTTVLAPPLSATVIPVACVEQGRWSRSTGFASSGDFLLQPGLRHLKDKGVQASVRLRAVYMANQGEVWSGVGDRVRRHAAASPSGDYGEVHRQRRAEIEGLVAGLRIQPGQRGVLALVAGNPVALDLFDNPHTLEVLWGALVGSYATDALLASGPAGPDHLGRAVEMVHGLAAGTATVHPAVGTGQVVQISGTADGIVSALVHEGAVIHMAALWPERVSEPGSVSQSSPWVRIERPTRRSSWFHQE